MPFSAAVHAAWWPLTQENRVRWLPLLIIFALVWGEISLFIQVANVIGVLLTMLLVIFTSCMGIALVKKQGMKNLRLMQRKLTAGENPAAEMIKSVSLVLAGILLLLPGFITDFIGLLLLVPLVQKHLTLRMMPHLTMWRGAGAAPDSGVTVDGEFERKEANHIGHQDGKPPHR